VINPVIREMREEMFAGYEGCMSIVDAKDVPTHRWRVPRHTSVVIDYTDEHGARHENVTLQGFTAVIFQHEYDHLQGVLIDACGADKITNEAYLVRKNAGEQGLYLSW
jgi:peptide deformylase